ncbi:MAG: CopG family transcriptional regulator, partial [Thiohalorhabdaceae bacterium]
GRLVKEEMRTEWPASVRQLAGAWPDFPETGELREGTGEDSPRETL